MLTIEEKKEIISKVRERYNLKRNVDFANWFGISEQCAYGWAKQGSYDVEKVYARCPELNAAWLLTGKGEMMEDNRKQKEDCDTTTTKQLELALSALQLAQENSKTLLQNLSTAQQIALKLSSL